MWSLSEKTATKKNRTKLIETTLFYERIDLIMSPPKIQR